MAAMKSATQKSYPYRAVSVKAPALGACEAVKAIQDARYLAADAPQLPLSDCSHADQCRCKYKHWNDRRQEEDRRSPIPGIGDALHAANDRRTNRSDRRRS